MAKAFTCCSWRTTTLPRAPPAVYHSPFVLHVVYIKNQQRRDYQTKSPLFTPFAAKSGGFSLDSIIKRCQTCGGQGAVDCAGCKGTGKNKKNGNIFERWKCYDCQGFGLKSCPSCGQGRGLTPEQRGER
ncbi:hypothetical protein RHMOL_Rhmol06G0156500 [Rhododendron molle]|uniref:Uncharacterized protein n=1 Tax=Rhododendron molle TaxID=49168 RepID=A0ACC0NDA6_RHOML|nr:hypothetical protein RHMOL_Rhmol06G0156500 [Rhododendron molle]